MDYLIELNRTEVDGEPTLMPNEISFDGVKVHSISGAGKTRRISIDKDLTNGDAKLGKIVRDLQEYLSQFFQAEPMKIVSVEKV